MENLQYEENLNEWIATFIFHQLRCFGFLKPICRKCLAFLLGERGLEMNSGSMLSVVVIMPATAAVCDLWLI